MKVTKPRIGDERGVALAMALIVLAVLSTFAALLLALAHYETASAEDARLAVQCEALAESGWNLVFRELAATRFDGRSTHLLDGDGRLIVNSEAPLVPQIISPLTGEVVAVIDGPGAAEGLDRNLDDGAYVWRWYPGAGWSSLSSAGVPEELRVIAYYNDPERLSFTIQVEAILRPVGNPITRRLRVTGRTQPLEQYALFSASDLALAGEATWHVSGAVHANGDLFLMPEGALVRLDGQQVTSAAELLRLRDPWEREELLGEVLVVVPDEEEESGFREVEWFTDPPFDSEHVAENEGFAFYDNDPTNDVTGCQELFEGAVRDGFMGIGSFQPPFLADADYLRPQAAYGIFTDGAVVTCLDADGAYYAEPLGAVTRTTVYNPATGGNVDLLELDLAVLADPNGDGDSSDSLWPANGILYVGGDCRLEGARGLPGDLALLCSGSIYLRGDVNVEAPRLLELVAPLGRIWLLSENWEDADAALPLEQRLPAALRVVAVLVDGQPVVSESGYAGGEGTAPPAALPLLEAWGPTAEITLEGAWVHLRTAVLAALGSPPVEGQIAWLTAEAYTPPVIRLVYDRRLETQKLPFPLTGARVVAWQRLTD
jgi:hypothetical protein